MTRHDELLNELKIDRRGGAPKKKRRWPIYAGIAVLALAAFFVLRGGKPVQVETVNPRSAAESGPASVLDASGYVTARRIATVSSKVTGKVKEVYIEEGQRVTEGEVLARLDVQDADAQYQLSRAQVTASESQLAEAQAQLALAESTYRRNKELAGDQFVSKSALDAAKADVERLIARWEALESRR